MLGVCQVARVDASVPWLPSSHRRDIAHCRIRALVLGRGRHSFSLPQGFISAFQFSMDVFSSPSTCHHAVVPLTRGCRGVFRVVDILPFVCFPFDYRRDALILPSTST